jgi:hypothetical protein
MEPKEKAQELVEKYHNLHLMLKFEIGWRIAIQWAIIDVEGTLSLPSLENGRMIAVIPEDYAYWQEVKQHLIEMK